MNNDLKDKLGIIESTEQCFPEDLDSVLEYSSAAVTCVFNRKGTLLGVGCNDGKIVIWDFLTKSVAKSINAHLFCITSLSWSHNGYKILSSSTDKTVYIHDVFTGNCELKFRLPSEVVKVQFKPRNNTTFLVSTTRHAAVLIHTNNAFKVVPKVEEGDIGLIASFDRCGIHIYVGNTKGKIVVLNSIDFTLKASFKISTAAVAVKNIDFPRHGDCFLTNCADRTIRVYNSAEVLICGKEGEPEPIQKLQDIVNKGAWKKCCFSGDGEYVCAGSTKQHELYIWGKNMGNLVKILQGSKGNILNDVAWHPSRPIIVSIANGVVSIWAQNHVEKWSAFSPDFIELEENVEYEERESEFDISDEDKTIESVHKEIEEDFEIDVMTVSPEAVCSSDEDCENKKQLFFLPCAPEMEESSDDENPACSWNNKPPEVRPADFDISIKLSILYLTILASDTGATTCFNQSENSRPSFQDPIFLATNAPWSEYPDENALLAHS
ncbi:retinoblastoma-binding protein 5 homolog [Lycorma delicatula]|uniref:retinoblastoma-binding protein 5 homolog n=1 Tax=Lycorma delicatula TaxID=130591 RepID=UPI003F51725C